MARMPGAQWRPLPRFSTSPMSAHDLICLHTMVGSLEGTDGYFRGITTGINSHYGTGGRGEKRQWGDTRYRSGANYNGNGRCITIENADMGPGFAAWDTRSAANVPAFTDDQAEAIAEILAWESSVEAHATCPPSWACHQRGIPLELVPDSKPGRRGVCYHREGCDPYRVAGGELWSTSYGKSCPADRRIGQIPQIITRAREIAGGAPSAPPLGEDMCVAIAVGEDQTCWIDDGTKMYWTHDIVEVESLAKLWRVPVVPMPNERIQKVIDFRSRRAAEYEARNTAALQRAMPGPNLTAEQVKALADEFFEQLAPKLEDASPLTGADLQRLLDNSEIDTANLAVDLMATRLAAGADQS